MPKHSYNVLVDIDTDACIVDVRAYRVNGGGQITFQTAWNETPLPVLAGPNTYDTWAVQHPIHGHTIMTYESRDEAVGEAMTSLRDKIDDEALYDRSLHIDSSEYSLIIPCTHNTHCPYTVVEPLPDTEGDAQRTLQHMRQTLQEHVGMRHSVQ